MTQINISSLKQIQSDYLQHISFLCQIIPISYLQSQKLQNSTFISSMKITVKTLRGDLIPIEIEPEATILDLKQQINGIKKIQIEDQKIVFKGRATVNTDILSAVGIKQNDFLVLMVSVKKPVSQKVQQKEEVGEEKKEQKNQEKKQEKKSLEIPKVPPTLEKSEESIAAEETKITNLMGMGFDREKCQAALQAAFGNQERAVEYLLNGIPPTLDFGNEEEDENVENIFRALVNNPNFETFRNLLRSDPNSIEAVLAQIANTSMPLYNLIAQNPQTFQRIVLEDQEDDEDYNDEGEEDGEVIELQPEEQAAIERLMGLGFTKLDVAQAYFACDKNEELAANLLFDRQANGDLGLLDDGEEEEDEDDNLFN